MRSFSCPDCGALHAAPASAAGTRANCAGCGHEFLLGLSASLPRAGGEKAMNAPRSAPSATAVLPPPPLPLPDMNARPARLVEVPEVIPLIAEPADRPRSRPPRRRRDDAEPVIARKPKPKSDWSWRIGGLVSAVCVLLVGIAIYLETSRPRFAPPVNPPVRFRGFNAMPPRIPLLPPVQGELQQKTIEFKNGLITFEDALVVDDGMPANRRGMRAKVYVVELQARRMYRIEMKRVFPGAEVLDPYLILEDANGRSLAEHDDNVQGIDQDAFIRFIPNETAKFRIVATTCDPHEIGTYQLIVADETALAPQPPAAKDEPVDPDN